MSIDISAKIGGEAEQGIQSAGNLIALVCQESGSLVSRPYDPAALQAVLDGDLKM